MNSEEIKNIYRIWQDRLRKENKNEEGDNETIALPTNDAANAELKRMLIECGVSSDEATKLVYEDISRIFNLLESDDDKYQSISFGRYKLKTDIGPDGKGKKGTPTFKKDDAGNYVETGEDDDQKDDSPELKQQTNQNYAQDGEERDPTQTSVDGSHLTNDKDDKQETPEERKQRRKKEIREKDDELVETQLRLKKGDEQDKGGAGTPESRTGETVTVYAGKKVKELMEDGMSYDDAREQVRQELLEISKEKDALLTKEWVESGLNCLDWIEDNYGLKNLEDIAWDTPEGNELVESTGHGTSADMFIRTNDGKTIGVSLKKDFKVFIVNGGFDKKIKEVAELLGLEVKDMPENIQPGHYNKRRSQVLEDGVPKLNTQKDLIKEKFEEALQNPEVAKSVFGKAYQKRINYIAARKAGISPAKFKKLPPEEQKQMVDNLTGDDLFDSLINKPPHKGDDIKVIANISKIPEVNKATNLYDDLRNLDSEIADNLMDFLNQGENLDKFKELVSKETHIDDILFGSGGALDKLEVLYGEKGGVSMSPEAVVNLFDMGELYERYNDADGDEKDEIKKKIQEKIKDKMVIQREQGKPVIAVRVENPTPPPAESILPIFSMATRTKGIGNSNGLEIQQSAFGGLCFKNGNVDIDSWSDSDKRKVVNDQVKGILNDIEDENLDPTTDVGKQELKERIKLLERWDENNNALKKLKVRFEL